MNKCVIHSKIQCVGVSQVYRSVLISEGTRSNGTTKQNSSESNRETGGNHSPILIRSSSTLPAPQASSNNTPSSSSSSSGPITGDDAERGDLIHFYNNVYIKQMRPFALRYSPSPASAAGDSPPLVPYPSLRTGSPRRMLLSSKHSIYISPHQSSPAASPSSPRDKMCYYICSSPPHRLQEINCMIRSGETPNRKRVMALDETETTPKRLCPDNHSTLLRRLQDVANDRSSSH